MNKKGKKKKYKKSLTQAFEEKKRKKIAKKQGKNIYKCIGGAHEPDGCGTEWRDDGAATQCPTCGNMYAKWLNFEERKSEFTN